jgi:hypothetical protein
MLRLAFAATGCWCSYHSDGLCVSPLPLHPAPLRGRRALSCCLVFPEVSPHSLSWTLTGIGPGLYVCTAGGLWRRRPCLALGRRQKYPLCLLLRGQPCCHASLPGPWASAPGYVLGLVRLGYSVPTREEIALCCIPNSGAYKSQR